MKNTITEVSGGAELLEGINRVVDTEEWRRDLKHRVMESTHTEQQGEKNQDKLRDLLDIKPTNIHIIGGFPKRERMTGRGRKLI